MSKRILITGGAGFIGSHLADELLEHGYKVRALDSLLPQVHGPERKTPSYLNPEVELLVGDVREPGMIRRALKKVDAVFHFAARVGVGQSMYEIEQYTSANNTGTAVLMEAVMESPVERLIVASSMSVYGEGLYETADGRTGIPLERTADQLRRGDWEVRDENNEILRPVPTPEEKTPSLASIYALSKYHQERMCLIFGSAYGIPTIALRFFNVFGSRQSLSNPYTGVLAIFASRILNGNRPLIYEDGRQQRDFVSVHDITRACRLALGRPRAAGRVFNIGSGQPRTILSIAEKMTELLGKPRLRPQVTRKYRMGDIRHCFSDISLAGEILDFVPRVPFDRGLVELTSWLEEQRPDDRFTEANAQLAVRRLTV